ncbi:MAG: ribosome small subunit-dependent GTPase A [Myxococcales bacterium]|nr:ribosome small subunit-dependent GTPase A [Myxococcales bacterium]
MPRRRSPARPATDRRRAEPNGRVVGRLGPVFTVDTAEGERVDCVAKGRGAKAVVGDRVVFERGAENEMADGLIVAIAERRSALVRADAMGRRAQVLAANIDRIFVVSAAEPPLREGLIDRYLVAAHQQGIEAWLVFNKLDLLDDEPEEEADVRERLDIYPPLGHPVLYVSAADGRGLDALREATRGRCSIFVGHSGVGKTSLLNALDPGLGERVQALSEASGRGQHTTSTSAMFDLPGGGEVIDSPGVRGFALWGLDPEGLKAHFPEFVERERACKFANCSHTHEPGCAVVEALDEGEIADSRYDSYLKILESLESDDPFPNR